MIKALSGLFALSVALGATPALSQTKWDLPAAYPATNFHSENLIQFAPYHLGRDYSISVSER